MPNTRKRTLTGITIGAYAGAGVVTATFALLVFATIYEGVTSECQHSACGNVFPYLTFGLIVAAALGGKEALCAGVLVGAAIGGTLALTSSGAQGLYSFFKKNNAQQEEANDNLLICEVL